MSNGLLHMVAKITLEKRVTLTPTYAAEMDINIDENGNLDNNPLTMGHV